MNFVFFYKMFLVKIHLQPYRKDKLDLECRNVSEEKTKSFQAKYFGINNIKDI